MGIAGTLFFVLIAVVDGALLTHVYDKRMPPVVRLCAGACTGFALAATLGFLAASLVGGLNAAVVWGPLAVLSVGALAAAWAYRMQLKRELAEVAQKVSGAVLHPTWTAAGAVVFYGALTGLLGEVFGKAVFTRGDGVYTGVANNLGDLPFHLQIISSFALGHNFPPQDPGFAGIRFAYPFLVDFLAAMMKQAGASLIAAMWIESMVLAIAMMGLLHYWTLELTRERLAGWLAPLLVLFSGGLGWWLLFQDVRSSDSGIAGLLQHLPHGYTIGADALWRWGNSFTTLFVPQRSILLGVPLALVIFTQWWRTVSGDPEGRENSDVRAAGEGTNLRMAGAGCLAGLLPLIHAHTYLVVMPGFAVPEMAGVARILSARGADCDSGGIVDPARQRGGCQNLLWLVPGVGSWRQQPAVVLVRQHRSLHSPSGNGGSLAQTAEEPASAKIVALLPAVPAVLPCAKSDEVCALGMG